MSDRGDAQGARAHAYARRDDRLRHDRDQPRELPELDEDLIERRVTTIGRVHPHVEVKVIDSRGRIVLRGRANRAGTLINVTSVGGLMTVPSYSLYNASKFAVEGLSEGLWYELGALGVRVKVIEPGAIATNFGGRSLDAWDYSAVPDYAPFMEKVKAARKRIVKNSSPPELVAETIYRAATDPSDRMRYLAGPDARRFVPLRRLLGAQAQMRLMRRIFRI